MLLIAVCKGVRDLVQRTDDCLEFRTVTPVDLPAVSIHAVDRQIQGVKITFGNDRIPIDRDGRINDGRQFIGSIGAIFIGCSSSNEMFTCKGIDMFNRGRIAGDDLRVAIAPVNGPLADGILAGVRTEQTQDVGLIHRAGLCPFNDQRRVDIAHCYGQRLRLNLSAQTVQCGDGDIVLGKAIRKDMFDHHGQVCHSDRLNVSGGVVPINIQMCHEIRIAAGEIDIQGVGITFIDCRIATCCHDW